MAIKKCACGARASLSVDGKLYCKNCKPAPKPVVVEKVELVKDIVVEEVVEVAVPEEVLVEDAVVEEAPVEEVVEEVVEEKSTKFRWGR